METNSAQAVFALNTAQLIAYINNQKYFCTFGEAYRTPEQAKIYAAEGKGIINSLHCKRLAIDLNLFDKNMKFLTNLTDYEPFGLYWETLHPKNRWGGKFSRPDADHFEMNEEI